MKDDCNPFSADFGNDHFSIRPTDKGEENHNRTLDIIFVEICKTIPQSKWKQSTNILKNYYKKSVILNDTDITDNVDPISKKIPRDDNPFQPDLSLFGYPTTPGK